MSNTPKTDALIASLTAEQARTYAVQTDKLLWIEYNLLDPAEISKNMAGRVEDALEILLSSELNYRD